MPRRSLRVRFRSFRPRKRRLLLVLSLFVAPTFYLALLEWNERSITTHGETNMGVVASLSQTRPALLRGQDWRELDFQWPDEPAESAEGLVQPSTAEAEAPDEGQPVEEAASPLQADEPPPLPPPSPLSVRTSPPPPPAARSAPAPTPPPPPPPPTATARPAPTAAPPTAAAGLALLEQQLFDGQNSERARAGLAPLRLDGGLEGVARRRASDMATNGYFSHTSPAGETAFTLIAAAGIYAPYAGENIGYNTFQDSVSASSVLAAFMASPGHRANILNVNFTRVGVGVAISASGAKYYAVVFGGP